MMKTLVVCTRAAIGRAIGMRLPKGHKLRPMHGMLSAGILIAVFALTAAAALYVAARVHVAGGRTGRGQPARDAEPREDA